MAQRPKLGETCGGSISDLLNFFPFYTSRVFGFCPHFGNERGFETPIEFGLFEQMCAGQTITRSRAAVGRTPSALHAVTKSFECQR